MFQYLSPLHLHYEKIIQDKGDNLTKFVFISGLREII